MSYRAVTVYFWERWHSELASPEIQTGTTRYRVSGLANCPSNRAGHEHHEADKDQGLGERLTKTVLDCYSLSKLVFVRVII